ncbi:MAG TPA: hypothetical protein VMU01_02310 [Rhizomicrobium sp.]|nr:hypothetical protein [Alphaproteobacteria bacterium]HUO97470.1 hypothetical protein [Rhizomicrobium sp.]
MLKKILIAVVVLVVVVAGAVYLLYSNLGPILKAGIEKYGSQATQSQVKVDSVTLSASSGQGTITGLVVDNPKGFTTPHAMELGSIAVTINPSTVTQNPVEVTAVTISAPHITYEQGENGGNLQKLQQNVTQYAGGSASAKSPSGQAPKPGSTPAQPATGSSSAPAAGPSTGNQAQAERKLIIDKLDVTDGQVTVAASLLKGKTLTTSLPAIHLTDIGKKEGGATPAQVAQLVISAISEQAAKAATSELQKAVGGAAGQQLKQLQDKAPDVGSQLKGLLK